MNANLFEEYHHKKEGLKAFAIKAFEQQWITEDKKNEIVDSIDHDMLTIGVIGQMKSGKSTFLNSFVFEDDVLPAATTPMTAALSRITYGEEKKIKAEFYTLEDWQEQKAMAAQSLDDVKGNILAESRIRAAKELVSRSEVLGDELEALLGKTKTDELENLIEYVGVAGKYISITKSVTIYYPKDYLKGVEIVDTPGFNDPIISREEKTNEFLKNAHVVLLMLYANQPFSETDRTILFKNVARCGIGKVLIGINKYDIPFCNEDSPEYGDEEIIKNHVKQQIRKACEESDDAVISNILSDVEPITLSAQMALLASLAFEKVSSNSDYDFHWKKHCSDFGVTTQADLKRLSHIDLVIEAIKKVIEKEKEHILSTKSINAILAAGTAKKETINTALRNCQATILNCSTTDDELDTRLKNYDRATKKLSKKIESFGYDLEDKFKKINKKAQLSLEDDLEATCHKLERLVSEMGTTEDFTKIQIRWASTIHQLVNKTLPRHIEEIQENAGIEISQTIEDFLFDIEELLYKYVDKDFDVEYFIKELKRDIHFNVLEKGVFNIDTYNRNALTSEKSNIFMTVFKGVYEIENTITLGTVNRIHNAYTHADEVNKLNAAIEGIRLHTNLDEVLKRAFDTQNAILQTINNKLIDQTLAPIQLQLEEITNGIKSKEAMLATAQKQLELYQAELKTLENQIEEMFREAQI